MHSGPIDAKLWIVLENPSEVELSSKSPYTGTVGKFLQSKYNLFGIDKSQVHIEYLSYDYTMKFPVGTAERKGQITEEVELLKKKIIQANPNVIFLLGEYPLFYLGDERNIKGWRGQKKWMDDISCKVIASYAPRQIMKQRYVDKKNNPGQWEALFHSDFARALKESKTKENVYSPYNLHTGLSFPELEATLVHIRDNAKLIGYDIETTGGFLIDCLSFCWDDENSVCIPWYIAGKEPNRFFSDEQFFRIFSLVKEILESDIPKVAQNSQFDTLVLREFYDIEVRNLVWDTMVAAHEMYSDLPKDLGTLISMYSNLPYMKELIHSGNLGERWKYNAMDSLASVHIMKGQIQEMNELSKEYGIDIYKHYVTITHPAIRVITDMQRIGVRVDESLRKKAIEQELTRISDIQEAMHSIFPFKFSDSETSKVHFNPGSSNDKKKFFLDAARCRKIFHQGKVTVNKKALELYATDKRESVRVMAENIMVYQQSKQMLSKLDIPLHKGRMCTAYSVGGYNEALDDESGTDTGRLTSKKSILGSGTNLQNLKKGLQRQQLIPDEGEVYIYSDLWAAEALLTALDAQEQDMLKMLLAGIKIHQWMLEETVAKFPKECALAKYDYKKAKQSVHGLNYNVQPKKMAEESGLPMFVTEWQFAMYHKKFPGIQLRHARINDAVNRRTPLKSFLGRVKIIIAPYSNELLNQCYAWKTQSTIGELTIAGMVKVYYLGLASQLDGKYTNLFPALNTHDGLATRVKESEFDKGIVALANAFNIPIEQGKLSVTVPLETGLARNFNDVENEQIHWFK